MGFNSGFKGLNNALGTRYASFQVDYDRFRVRFLFAFFVLPKQGTSL